MARQTDFEVGLQSVDWWIGGWDHYDYHYHYHCDCHCDYHWRGQQLPGNNGPNGELIRCGDSNKGYNVLNARTRIAIQMLISAASGVEVDKSMLF